MHAKKFQIIFLLFSATLIFMGRQLDIGITNYDDAYYAQKAKEMLVSGNFWVVTHQGIPSFDNPPLQFWFTSLAFKVFGISGYSAVLFTALLGVATIYLTYKLTFYLFKDNWTAFCSAFVLIFPGMFIDGSRRGMVDVPLAFFVTAAIFSFIKGMENKKFYLLYGLMTAFGMLTKSLPGLFPLIIGFSALILTRQGKELLNPYLLVGFLIALFFGFSWHIINWVKFGDIFFHMHFITIIFARGYSGHHDPFFFLGYFEGFLRNYLPWVFLAPIALVVFAKRAFPKKDYTSMVLLLWVLVVFGVMSSLKNQSVRYLFMIFPALAVMISKIIADWLDEMTKEKIMPYLVCIIMFTVLFVNVTPFQVKVTFSPNSLEVRQLAALANLNTPPEKKIGNYSLTLNNPAMAMLFYSNRALSRPIKKPSILLKEMEKDPGSTWLTHTSKFKKLEDQYPNHFYLIQANRKYAYFTSKNNTKNIRYDFSEMPLPLIR